MIRRSFLGFTIGVFTSGRPFVANSVRLGKLTRAEKDLYLNKLLRMDEGRILRSVRIYYVLQEDGLIDTIQAGEIIQVERDDEQVRLITGDWRTKIDGLYIRSIGLMDMQNRELTRVAFSSDVIPRETTVRTSYLLRV